MRLSCSQVRDGSEGRRRLVRASGWLGVCAALGLAAGVAEAAPERFREGPREPAVAAPNLRLALAVDFLHVDETESFSSAGGNATLEIPSHDATRGRAELIGTLPLYGPLGARVIGRAGYGEPQRSLDGLSRGTSEVTDFGGGAELFLRDPALGSFAAGGGFDRVDGDGSLEEDLWSGHAEAAVFFPDLGSGPVDWVLRFDFSHGDISGTTGSADFDKDRYQITGSAGWYLTHNVQLVMGGRWDRSEEEFTTVDNREGFLRLRARLPGPVPLELSLGGTVGQSEYEQSSFRADLRLLYRASAGLVLRFGSGATLIDSIRRYD